MPHARLFPFSDVGLKLEGATIPYIPRDRRGYYDLRVNHLAELLANENAAEGDLNYVVTQLVRAWLGPNANYGRYNAAIGVLECAKLELYRKQVARYEDAAMVKNGPLPDPRRAAA